MNFLTKHDIILMSVENNSDLLLDKVTKKHYTATSLLTWILQETRKGLEERWIWNNLKIKKIK